MHATHGPWNRTRIYLGDLRRCRHAHVFRGCWRLIPAAALEYYPSPERTFLATLTANNGYVVRSIPTPITSCLSKPPGKGGASRPSALLPEVTG